MEASIIFHFAGRGDGNKRLALVDFAQLLDPKWRAPTDIGDVEKKLQTSTAATILSQFLKSAYNFIQGGVAGAFGATIVYPIDLGELLCSSR